MNIGRVATASGHLLHRNGRILIGRPLRERRARLEDAIADNDLVLPVRRLTPDGLQAWAQVIERDYEDSSPESSLDEAGPDRSLAFARYGRSMWT